MHCFFLKTKNKKQKKEARKRRKEKYLAHFIHFTTDDGRTNLLRCFISFLSCVVARGQAIFSFCFLMTHV